jgi:hypothetical protein
VRTVAVTLNSAEFRSRKTDRGRGKDGGASKKRRASTERQPEDVALRDSGKGLVGGRLSSSWSVQGAKAVQTARSELQAHSIGAPKCD